MGNFTQAANAGRSSVTTWVLDDNDLTGQALLMPGAPDRTVQVSGDFGGGTVVLEGSNLGSVWNTLHAPDGAELSFTTGAIAAVLENPAQIRPRLIGGSVATVVVSIASRS